MITPVEVLGKELKRGFGYKAVEVDEFLEDLSLITREAEEKLSISSQNILFFQEKNEMDLIARNYVVRQMDGVSEEFRNVLKNLDIQREKLIRERNSLPWE